MLPILGETADDARSAPARHVPRVGAMLVVALECDRPTAGAARFFLDGVDLVTFGRANVRSALRNQDGRRLEVGLIGAAVSRSHARLVRLGTQWVVEDAASRNGTLVNGVRTTRAVLERGDIVEIGRTLLYVEPDATLPPSAPPDLDAGVSDPAGTTLHPDLAEQLDAVERVARSRVPVLILGETGSGKEVLAQRLHRASGRTGSFVALNCGAFPPHLVEAALFGHVRGAFSGAIRDERGFVRAAEGGTLFLDEVAELPKTAQAALLRVLQEHEVTPVGTTATHHVDLRVVAATNACLEEAVALSSFRGDLLARLSGLVVKIPPLRARMRDIGTLVAAILRRVVADPSPITLTPDAGTALLRHRWPNNVRELEQALTAAVALAGEASIDLAHLPASLTTKPDPAQSPAPTARWSARDEALRLELLARLDEHRGNVADVARAMGKARSQVHRWLRRFAIEADYYRS